MLRRFDSIAVTSAKVHFFCQKQFEHEQSKCIPKPG
jgi:hypothetical protein